MSPKQLQAKTEGDLRAILTAAEKAALAIGGRFGDIDNCMVRSASDLLSMIERWAEEQRKYMSDCVADDLWKGL